MAGPGGYIKSEAERREEIQLAAVRHHELRHLRRLRVALLILLSPIWMPFFVLTVAIAALSGLVDFLKDGPS
jgi:hypothetical protein